jgi:hypothetical protein
MKRLTTLVFLLAISAHAFAWSHTSSGASRAAHLKANTEKHYNYRVRR